MIESVLIITIIILSLVFALSYKVYLRIVKKEKRTVTEEISYLIEKGVIEKGYYESLKKEEFNIKTKEDFILKCFLIKTDEKPKGTIICSHGVSCTHGMMIKHVDFFTKNKFNVILFDQRRHGSSEGLFTSYGYYEKEDLSLLLNYVREKFSGNMAIGVIGESMGASTALQMLEINDKVDFLIAECPFSNFESLMKIHLKKSNIFPYLIFGKLASFLSYLKHGFKFKDIKPIKAIKNKKTPILFIHGTEDKTTPYEMSEKMSRSYENSTLYLVRGAGHKINCNVSSSRNEYEKTIADFLAKVIDS
ncbi:MAG: alpha/beta hydrolase [Clostridiaceae bacterium]